MISNLFSADGRNVQQGEAVAAPPRGALNIGTPDVIDLLPAEAQGHLSALRDQVENLYRSVEDLGLRRQEARDAKAAAEMAYREMTDPAIASRTGRAVIFAEDDERAVAAKQKLDRAASAARAAQDRYDAAASRWQAQMRLLTDVEGYIASARQPLEMAPPIKVRLPSTIEKIEDEIRRLRHSLEDLRAEKHEVTSAAFPAAEAIQRARAEIEALAEAGRPNVLRMIDLGADDGVMWSSYAAETSPFGLRVKLPGDVAHTANNEPAGGLATLAWLFKDKLIQALEKEISAHAEDDAALSTEARAAKLADLDKRILDVEMTEAEIVLASRGLADFRPDSDPRAALGIVGPAPRRED